MNIQFIDNQVIIPIPKAILVLTRAQFIQALRRGKSYRRAKALQARQAPTQPLKRV
jgi:hypothetical protein